MAPACSAIHVERRVVSSQACFLVQTRAHTDTQKHTHRHASPHTFDEYKHPQTTLALQKVFLEQLEGELESENPWERVVSLVDTQSEVVEDFKDTSRMTSILIQLKNEPLDDSASAAAAS